MNNRSIAKVDAVYSGVDWISATLGREEIDSQTWVYDALHALEVVARLGNTYKQRSLLGFDGWESAGCFVGSNETRHYAQFAGSYAHNACHYLDHPKVHISRIDLQVTVQYSIELLKEGRYQYARAVHHNKTLPDYKRRKVNLFAGSDGSDTVYLGAPTSDTRLRVYNKDKQSGDDRYARSWRYEVVYRNEYALPVYRSVISALDTSPTIIISTVVAYCRARGINILGLDDWRGNAVEIPKAARTDVARKLAWIKSQVVPTVRKLAEMGYAEELMEVIAEAISAARNGQK